MRRSSVLFVLLALVLSSSLQAEYPLWWYGRTNNVVSNAANIKADGGNGAIVYNFTSLAGGAVTGARNYLDGAAAAGIDVIIQINQSDLRTGQIQRIEQYVDGVKDHPALAGWYIYDEPDEFNVSVEEGEAAYNAIKARSNLPIYGAINANRADVQTQYRNSYDVMLGFRYPFHTSSPEFEGLEFDESPPEAPGEFPSVLPGWKDQIEETKIAATLNGKGFVNVLQATGKPEFGTRLPTDAEFRFMVHFSVVSQEVDGLSFWAKHRLDESPADATGPYPFNGATWRQQVFIPVLAEFNDKYGDAIAEGAVPNSVTSSSAQVKARFYRDSQTQAEFVLAVNEEQTSATAVFQLSQVNVHNRARLIQTGEEFAIVNGSFSYDFPKYGTASFELFSVTVDAEADGEAYGVAVDAPPVELGKTPYVSLPAEGGSEQDSISGLQIPGLIDIGAVDVATMGQLTGNNAYVQSTAATGALNILGGLVTADSVVAQSTSESTGRGPSAQVVSRGDGEIVNLTINGVSYGDTSPPANTVVAIPGVANVILNEQISSGDGQRTNGLRVNMIRVELLDSLGTVSGVIEVGSAYSYLEYVPADDELVDFVTGGGWIGEKRQKATFGVSAGRTYGGGFRGSLQYNDHELGFKLHALSIDSFWLDPASDHATFSGSARVDNQVGYRFFATVTDNGEGNNASPDEFSLVVIDGENNIVYDSDVRGAELGGGNLQVHRW